MNEFDRFLFANHLYYNFGTLLHGVAETDMVNKILIYKEMVHLLAGEVGRRGT